MGHTNVKPFDVAEKSDTIQFYHNGENVGFMTVEEFEAIVVNSSEYEDFKYAQRNQWLKEKR